MLNPTGEGVRVDPMGNGNYGASRGTRTHNGVDLIVCPGQAVFSPIDGKVVRKILAYANDSYYGVQIEGKRATVSLLYLRPLDGVVGSTIKKGEIVGTAQDISKRYNNNMIPHIHMRIDRCDPLLFIGMP